MPDVASDLAFINAAINLGTMRKAVINTHLIYHPSKLKKVGVAGPKRRRHLTIKQILSRMVFGPISALVFISAMVFAGQPPSLPRYASGQINLDDPTRVDVALVLAVDVSSSIKSNERRFQREAYAQALSDPRVAALALGGGSGRVAIAYMEWSGNRYQRVHLPIRVMSTPNELAQFGREIMAITDTPNDPMYVQPTAVGNALLAAENAMSALSVPARDYIIDISGDGIINDGFAVLAARERLLALGLTVNGLPIEVSDEPPTFEDMSHERVAQFYMDCVIGGPGAFHVVARGFNDVRETLIMKLMLEMARLSGAQKRQIAANWNTGRGPETARIVPATVLHLGPTPPEPRQPSNCGEHPRSSQNPFKTSH